MTGTATLTKTLLSEGIWQGVLTCEGKDEMWQPRIEVTHLDETVDGVTITKLPDEDGWLVEVAVPIEAISDGVQTFLIYDSDSHEPLASFAVLAGDALAEDIRAELDLMRAELELVKRAFRRHCLETM